MPYKCTGFLILEIFPNGPGVDFITILLMDAKSSFNMKTIYYIFFPHKISPKKDSVNLLPANMN
jgi:hypothetical protein